MNYIIENNIDFFSELNKELSDDSNQNNICLLTHQLLEENFITLLCGHKFNYIPLYNEVCNQKKDNYLETTHLSINQIKCPYCRSITNKLLPYIEHKDVVYKRGINYPLRYCMSLYSCQWMKYGKNKHPVLCNKGAFKSEHGTYCSHHQNLCKNKQIKQEKKQQIESIWTSTHEEISKKYTVSQLRQILRDNKNQNKSKSFIISGNKKELIHRIITWGLLEGVSPNSSTNLENTSTNLENTSISTSYPLIDMQYILNMVDEYDNGKDNATAVIQKCAKEYLNNT